MISNTSNLTSTQKAIDLFLKVGSIVLLVGLVTACVLLSMKTYTEPKVYKWSPADDFDPEGYKWCLSDVGTGYLVGAVFAGAGSALSILPIFFAFNGNANKLHQKEQTRELAVQLI